MPSLIVRTFVGLIMAFTGAASSAQQADSTGNKPATAATDAAQSTRDLRIRFSGEQFPLDFVQLNELLNSSRVCGAAVTDISGKLAKPLDAPRSPWTDGKTTYAVGCEHLTQRGGGRNRTPASGIEMRLRFFLTGGDQPENDSHLSRFAEAITRRLAEALTELASQDLRVQIDTQRRILEQERQQAAESEEKVRRLRRELRSVAPVEATQALLTESISQLQRQQQSFELELVGMKARAEAIQDYIKQLTERIRGRAETDDVVRNLQRVVGLRAEQLRRVTDLKIHRAISEEEKAKAEEQFFLAQIELDRARRESQRGSSEQLDKMTADLANIAIATAEIDAKLKYVSSKLDETRKLLAIDVNDAQPLRDRLTAETAALQAALAEVQKRQADLARLTASFQPVTVEMINFEPVQKAPKK